MDRIIKKVVVDKRMNFRWLLLMAWRDSRRNRSRLFLFISSIILGIAALVAIYSLGDNLRKNVDLQAAALIGADLEISGNKAPKAPIQKLLDSLGRRQSSERSFASMILFPKSGGTRLVQIRALFGDFPYYGKLETVPASAAKDFRKQQAALVDKTLMLQFGAKVGDSIAVGNVTFRIAGTLSKAPGQTGLSASVAPAVYIPLQYLELTGLATRGSRINYKTYVKFNKPHNVEQLAKTVQPRIEAEGLDYETVESQKEDTGRSFEDLTRFLALVGFIALLLGCIGVASAIHIYVREKINMIAILRCLGTKGSQAFAIFLIQIVGIGIIGSMIGAGLGTVIQQFLPKVLEDFLPVKITTSISVPAILQGIALGIIISILFALLPLVSIRNVSPLNTLRISFQEKRSIRDPLKWLVNILIILFIATFIYQQVGEWKETIFFTAGVLIAFMILSAMAWLLMWMVRKFFPSSWSYLWRQALSNLFRPNNQTIILIVSIGLGTCFICTLIFVQSILINRVTLTSGGEQPNIVLFDIQSKQVEDVATLARNQGLPVRPTVPIVNMRLDQVNGRTADQAQEDTMTDRAWRLYAREYRVTYRDSITPFEKITEGKWRGIPDPESGNVYISLEQNWAKRQGLKLGDTLVFNVQGVMVPTIIGSFREVDWNRIQTNFLVVFPKNVIEKAPQFHVMLTRTPSPEVSARFQQAVVKQFPNISIIDLGLVLSILDDLLDKIAFVIKFIAAFSIITGLVVLIASVLISKYQRIQESVLLRTIGAVKRQIFMITALEYFFLGALAAATGIILAMAASWALAHYSFETTFSPQLLPILAVFFSVSLLTVIIGLINSRDVLTKPPLEILRQDV